MTIEDSANYVKVHHESLINMILKYFKMDDANAAKIRFLPTQICSYPNGLEEIVN